MADNSAEVVRKPNWIVGILAAIVVGLIGAIIYAAVIGLTDEGTEIGYLAILIGFGAGWALSKFGRVSGIGAGIVGAIIGLLCWAFAVLLGLAWFTASMGYGNIFSNLGDLLPHSWELFQVYFEESAKGYLFAVLAAGSGLLAAVGLNRRNK
jgi:hypothetical protein